MNCKNSPRHTTTVPPQHHEVVEGLHVADAGHMQLQLQAVRLGLDELTELIGISIPIPPGKPRSAILNKQDYPSRIYAHECVVEEVGKSMFSVCLGEMDQIGTMRGHLLVQIWRSRQNPPFSGSRSGEI
jgi:hypothetical protein